MKPGYQLLLGMVWLSFCPSTHCQIPDPLNQWQVITNQGVRISIRGLAYQDGHFVAGGVTTHMIVSTNGVNWVLIPSGVTNIQAGIQAVAEGAGKFVAVGNAGLILSSSDGLQWTNLRTDLRDDLWAVLYAGGQFVIVGYHSEGNVASALAVTSADGVHWERYVQPFYTTPRNVAYGNGLYVAAGAPVSMYSSNGRDWTPLNGVLAQGIAYGNGQFIATLQRTGYRSSNGVDWTQIDLPTIRSGTATYGGNYYTATYANGTFMIGGFCDECPNEGRPMLLGTSTDGSQWSLRVFGADNAGPIRDILFVDGLFYLGDQSGKIWKSGPTAPSSRPSLTQVTYDGRQTTLSFAAGSSSMMPCQTTSFGKTRRSAYS